MTDILADILDFSRDMEKARIESDLATYARDGIACTLEGWTHGHLAARAYPLTCGAWLIVSDCDSVKIRVPHGVAQSRIHDAGKPAFYYE